jgi:hypothetical protein
VLEAPEKMVAQLLGGWCSNWHHANVAWVEAASHIPNCATFARRVEALKEHEQPRTNLGRVKKSGGKEAQLDQTALGFQDATFRLFARQ